MEGKHAGKRGSALDVFALGLRLIVADGLAGWLVCSRWRGCSFERVSGASPSLIFWRDSSPCNAFFFFFFFGFFSYSSSFPSSPLLTGSPIIPTPIQSEKHCTIDTALRPPTLRPRNFPPLFFTPTAYRHSILHFHLPSIAPSTRPPSSGSFNRLGERAEPTLTQPRP